MVQELKNSHALLLVFFQKKLDGIKALIAHINVLPSILEISHFFSNNLILDLLTRFPIEWILARDHGIHQNAERPNIYLGIARIISLQQLRCHVLDRSRIVSLGNRARIRAKNTEIGNLHMHFRRRRALSREFINVLKQDHILKLDIAMNYSAIMTAI